MITLSGLGLNYKTTICNLLEEANYGLTVSRSASSLYKQINDTIGAPNCYYLDKVTCEYLRAKFIQADVMDRGPEDALCFEVLKAEGALANIWDYAWTTIWEKRYQYVDLINSLNRKRLFLYNGNTTNIDRIIKSLGEDSLRVVLYKTVDDYVKLQDAFYTVYCELFPDHELIVMESDNIDEDCKLVVNKILSWNE